MNLTRQAATEHEITIPGAYPLGATLALPAGSADERFPVVIMIHGSGPIDRDSNAKGMPIQAFREFSDLAVSLGFAALRYDKRGVGASGGNYDETGFYDLVDDAAAAAAFARAHPRLDPNRVILLGHSEGCFIAPVVNARTPVQGLILVAPGAEPLADTMAWQRELLYEDIRTLGGFEGWLLRFINLEKKIRKMNDDMLRLLSETDAPVVKYKGKKINAKWQREHTTFDVRVPLREVTCPVLSVVGAKDVQVKQEHAAAVCDLVQGPCESKIIPDMTHILRRTDQPTHMSSIMKDYKRQIKQPVAAELKNEIGRWLTAWLSGAAGGAPRT
ncbi:alpha/beta hydrolase [Paenibacillus sp. TRM 82003]|nr:alpha/beta hydrolase [Paenibacillus sp. TRM 82003]